MGFALKFQTFFSKAYHKKVIKQEFKHVYELHKCIVPTTIFGDMCLQLCCIEP